MSFINIIAKNKYQIVSVIFGLLGIYCLSLILFFDSREIYNLFYSFGGFLTAYTLCQIEKGKRPGGSGNKKLQSITWISIFILLFVVFSVFIKHSGYFNHSGIEKLLFVLISILGIYCLYQPIYERMKFDFTTSFLRKAIIVFGILVLVFRSVNLLLIPRSVLWINTLIFLYVIVFLGVTVYFSVEKNYKYADKDNLRLTLLILHIVSVFSLLIFVFVVHSKPLYFLESLEVFSIINTLFWMIIFCKSRLIKINATM